MQKGNHLSAILRSPKTVFSTKDIALLWNEPASLASRVRLNYYVKKGDLVRIRKGLYAKGQSYNPLELATRIFTPAYVSFETVLVKAGLIFQYYDTITVASYLTREIVVGQHSYAYRKMKDMVLTNAIGVEHIDETSIAGKERAFLDMLYVSPDYQFDNLHSIHWEKVFAILPIYNNQRMAKQVQSLYREAKDQAK